MIKDDEELAILWDQQLKTCQYVGEISLEEKDLVRISRAFLNDRFRSKYKDCYETVLLVLAVNCAYYYYDDKGFWSHFTEITGIDNTEAVGSLLEKKLRKLGLLKTNRSGPFRYVGSVLEQCGISRRYIPSFIRIIKEWKERLGWGRLLNLPYSEFVVRVREVNCANYLKSFLYDSEGFKFTLQVCKLIKMYEDRMITKEELETLQGFRPGFWTKVFENFKPRVMERSNPILWSYNPQVVLDLYKKSFGLKFPSREFLSGLHNQGHYEYPLTRFISSEYFQEFYSGSFTLSDGSVITWETKGWLPNGLPSLFHKHSLFHIPREKTFYPGEYYLVAPESYTLPSNIQIKDLGLINVYSEVKYSLRLIRLNFGDRLAHFNIASKSHDHINMNWTDNKKNKLFLHHNGFYDVFVGEIPSLELTNFKPLQENIVGLFYDTGIEKGRIRNESDLAVFQEMVNRNVPVKGRVWLDVISRNRTFQTDIFSEIVFYVIPNILPDFNTLFGNEQEIEVVIPYLESFNVRFNECREVESEKGRWRVPKFISTLSGKFHATTFEIDFSIPIYRAGFSDNKGRKISILIPDEVDDKQGYIVRGFPGSRVVLSINGLIRSFGNFDSFGIFCIPGIDMRSFLKDADIVVAPLFLMFQDCASETGTYIVNIDELTRQFLNVDLEELFPNNRSDLYKTLRLIRAFEKEPIIQIQINKLPSFSDRIDRWIDSFFSCAEIFDGSVISVSGKDVDWFEKTGDTELKQILTQYKNDTLERIVEADVERLPQVKRWIELIRLKLSKSTPDGRMNLIFEWAKEVQGKKYVRLRSDISKLQGGNLLTQAWISYLRGNNHQAIKRLNSINELGGQVHSLKTMLWSMILMREARFNVANQVLCEAWSDDLLEPARRLLKSITSIVTNRNLLNEDLLTSDREKIRLLLKRLPLQNDDEKLLNQFLEFLLKKDLSNWETNESDWLNLWIKLNASIVEESSSVSDVAFLLKQIMDRIPASPERETIIDVINLGIRSN